MPLTPESLWRLSRSLHRAGHRRLARAVKGLCFIVFRCVLPPEAYVLGRVHLGHFGMGVVIHPNVTLGDHVRLWHGVTISVSDTPGTSSRVTIGDRVEIGTGAVIISPLKRSLTICSDVKVGANAVVTKSIGVPGTYIGQPAALVRPS